MSVEMITEENLDSESREVHYVSENGRVEGLILESRQAVEFSIYKVVDERTCNSKHS